MVRQVVLVLLTTCVATVAAAILESVAPTGEAELLMAYVACAAVAAPRLGLGASVAMSVALVLSYNVFFVAPRFTIYVDDPSRLITFVALGGVAMLISALAARARRLALAAADAERRHLRTTLLATLSHDLRTPLASVTGAATTLLSLGDSLSPLDREALIRQIADESARLRAIMDKVLQMSRLASDDATLDLDWNIPEEIVAASLSRVRKHRPSAELTVDASSTAGLVYVDALLLETALINLTENALQYGPAGGPVGVDVSQDDVRDDLLIRVVDCGPGLPDNPERLFDTFVRGDQACSKGTGLGLAIVYAIVQLHGGSVWAENRSEGGARVTLRLPRGGPNRLAQPSLEPE